MWISFVLQRREIRHKKIKRKTSQNATHNRILQHWINKLQTVALQQLVGKKGDIYEERNFCIWVWGFWFSLTSVLFDRRHLSNFVYGGKGFCWGGIVQCLKAVTLEPPAYCMAGTKEGHWFQDCLIAILRTGLELGAHSRKPSSKCCVSNTAAQSMNCLRHFLKLLVITFTFRACM